MSHHRIEEYLIRLDNEAKEFKEDLFRMSWYMRGGVSVNDLMYLYSAEERKMILNIINENIETSKQVMMPLI